MYRIPFSFLPPKALAGISRPFVGIANSLSKIIPFLEVDLIRADIKAEEKDYISMCLASVIFFFILFTFFLSAMLFSFKIENYIPVSIGIGALFSFFVFIQQIYYPRLLSNKKIREVDRNLLPAMQSMLVQFSSGVPLFDILVNISKSDYGQVSVEIGKAVKEINSGTPQLDALEDIATKNPSLFFRRAIWQIVNGMKSGADISDVISEVIRLLSEEQIIQIQNYGSQLNPLAMFYMLIAIIIPSLSVTFIIMLSSFISLSETTVKIIFFGLYALIVFIQMMFLGVIKSRRPNLASD